jgi:hypothetical protein
VQEGIRYSFLKNRSEPADRRNVQSGFVTAWPGAPHQDFDARTFDQLQEKSSATQKPPSNISGGEGINLTQSRLPPSSLTPGTMADRSSFVPYAHTMADRSSHLTSGSRRTASVKDAKELRQKTDVLNRREQR